MLLAQQLTSLLGVQYDGMCLEHSRNISMLLHKYQLPKLILDPDPMTLVKSPAAGSTKETEVLQCFILG